MTECSRCGDCCDPVHLDVSPADIAAMREAKRTHYGKRQATNKTQAWLDGLILIGKRWNGKRMTHLYRCPHFTAERTCDAHGMRPKVCSDYPWYGREPERGDTTMGGRCSFLADAGYKMLPIVSVT